jgi:aminopeptidase N
MAQINICWKINQLLLLFLLLFSIGCKVKNAKQTAPVEGATQALAPIKIKLGNAPNPYRAAVPINWVIDETKIDIDFNFEEHSANGLVVHTLSALRPFMDTLVLDSKGLQIESAQMTMRGNWLLACRFWLRGDKLLIALPIEPKAKEQFQMTIRYKSFPDKVDAKGSASIREAKGLYFINAMGKDSLKPIQIWTQGETEGNSCWFPTIDKPNHKSKFEINITVPDEFTTLSNGNLISKTKKGNLRTDKWVQDKPMSAYLVMMAIGKYHRAIDNSSTKYLVDYYVEPAYKDNAQGIFARTPQMINFFETKLGVPFPWAKYSQVTARDYVSGAMENTSASLFGEFVQQHHEELIDADNDNIVAHELFHQWFGDLVTCKSWSNLFVNEAFASYGENLWLEYKGNVTVMEKAQYADLNRYLSYAKNTADGPIVNYYYNNREDMFNALTYRKGSRVLHLLRHELGDEYFFTGLKKYLTDFAYQAADVRDLQKCFENVSGRDLGLFFDQWVFGGGHPQLKLRYEVVQDSFLKIVYEQKSDSGKIFKFPFTFKLLNGANEMKQKFEWSKAKDSLLLNISELVKIESGTLPIIIADAQHSFIGTIQEEKSSADFAKAFSATNSYFEKASILSALIKKDSISNEINSILDQALQSDEPLIRQLALNTFNRNSTSFDKDRLQKKLLKIAASDVKAYNRSAALNYLSSYKNAANIEVATAALKDSATQVVEAAYECLAASDISLAYKKAKENLNYKNEEVMAAQAAIIAKNPELADAAYFYTVIPRSFGSVRSQLLYAQMKHAAGLAQKYFLTQQNNNLSNEESIQAKEAMLKAIAHNAYYAANDDRNSICREACTYLQMLLNSLNAVPNSNDQVKSLIASVQEVKNRLQANKQSTEVAAAWKSMRKLF